MSTKAELIEEIKKLYITNRKLEDKIEKIYNSLSITRDDIKQMIQDAIDSHNWKEHERDDYR